MVSYSYAIPANGLLSGAVATNSMVLRWSGQSALGYVVQWSSDLVKWSNVSVGRTNSWVDTNPVSALPKRFYRLTW